MKCPGFEKLIDFLDGQITGEEARQMKDHLDHGCDDCLRNRAWYETVRSIARTDPVFTPAPWVRKRAIDLFEGERTRSRGLIETAQAAAQLIYDSMQRLSLAGARPASTSGRQLIYKGTGYNIDIQIAASSNAGADIMGQVLREGEQGFGSVAGLLVDLIRDQHQVWSTTTSSFGEFMMHEVDFGQYDLRIETPETIITIEGLAVSE
jgi:hypothetical protein